MTVKNKKEIIKKYKGYSIRNWIHPISGKVLIAIPLEAKCFVVSVKHEKDPLKTIKLFIDGKLK